VSPWHNPLARGSSDDAVCQEVFWRPDWQPRLPPDGVEDRAEKRSGDQVGEGITEFAPSIDAGCT
jgi:hypothetical protein